MLIERENDGLGLVQMIFLATRGVCPGVHVPAVHLPGCYSPSFRCKQSVDLLDRKGSKWRSQRAHFKQLELVSSVLLATDVGKKPIADTDIVYIYMLYICTILIIYRYICNCNPDITLSQMVYSQISHDTFVYR